MSEGFSLHAAGPARVSKGNVLVLDDDSAIRETVREILEEVVAVKAVGSIGAAWNAFKDCTFDVVVSDHALIEGTGVEFLRQVATTYPRVTRILLTGDVDSPQVRALAAKARDDGQTLVLFKPVDPNDLLSWVVNGIAMARLARARARFGA